MREQGEKAEAEAEPSTFGRGAPKHLLRCSSWSRNSGTTHACVQLGGRWNNAKGLHAGGSTEKLMLSNVK